MNSAIRTSTRSFPLKPLAAAVLWIYVVGVQSAPVFNNLPSDGIINEHISIDQSVDDLTTVTQTNNRDVINWREFSILEGETVRFVQPGTNAVILNRVTGEDVSQIFGTLQANGRVFLINPNGIVFGATSQVNVGALVASTLNLKQGSQNNNSNNDEIDLELDADAASIINNGQITANDILLIAPTITNNGTLTGRVNADGLTGSVQLIAASEVTVNTSGDNLAFEVQAGHENTLIEQLGEVMAQGGRVVLLATPDSSGTAASVINLGGINRATHISVAGNSVSLSGAINSGNGTGMLEVNAVDINQTAAANVDIATLNARNVTLGNAGNNFGGQLTLNVLEQVSVSSNADLSVQGNVGNTTLNANNLLLGDLTVTDNLTATAQESIDQIDNRTLTVGGGTNLTAVDATLNNTGNSFFAPVNLDVAGQASLRGAGRLEVAGRVEESATLETQNLILRNLAVGADLNLKANTIDQTDSLVVQGATQIESTGAVNLALSNDFVNGVTLTGSNGATVNLTDKNSISVSGQAGAVNINATESADSVVTLHNLRVQSLAVNANTVRNADQSNFAGAVNVSGTTQLTASQVELSNAVNNFGGAVDLQVSEEATLRDVNTLIVQGSANIVTLTGESIEFQEAFNVDGDLTLQANSISQTADLTVAGATLIGNGESAILTNAGNEFGRAVELRNAGNVELADRNSITVFGNAETLNMRTNSGATTLGEPTAGELRVGALVVNAERVDQSARLVVNGEANLNASRVELNDFENDFEGQVTLGADIQADLLDVNTLRVAGRSNLTNLDAQTLIVDGLTTQGVATLTADEIRQEGALIANSELNLKGRELNLSTSSNNIFAGAVTIDLTGDATIRSSNDLVLTGTAASVNAAASNNLTVSAFNAQDITLSAAEVNLQNFTAPGNLTLNGGTIRQQGALTVEGTTTLGASNVLLGEQPNDFQGNVVLNVSGNATVRDGNTLNVAGQVNGETRLFAESIGQSEALRTNSTLLLQANNVNLTDAGNRFNGAVRIEGAAQSALVSEGDLVVTGSNLGSLDLTAEEVMLNELGSIQQLTVSANEVKQGAALLVQGQTTLTANKVEFNNANNDFVDTVVVQARDSTSSSVQIVDVNSLSIEGEDLALQAQVQGDLAVQANNLELGRSTVVGATRIDLTGGLTQTRSITLNGSQLTAGRIILTHSGNLFNGTTRLDSDQLIELRTNGDFTGDTGSSTGALAMNIGGNTDLQGEQITLAQSRFGGDLTVNANQVSQSTMDGGIEVQGTTQLAALGGVIDLRNENNQFDGNVSANAEQTSLAANGDLRVLNLMSRGGDITAGDRLLLLGNIEQTGGTLTFTARGMPRPLSSAELALMLPPSLDVFSSKEAVNPITGFGRLEVASAAIDQQSGQISTDASATTLFHSTRNGSINLTQVNQMNGRFASLSGSAYGQAFVYRPNRGTSLFAVNNDVRLRVSERGVESDLVAIRSRGLSTQGASAVIHARMPYNDIAVGTSRSFPGLTLSIPLSNSSGTQGGAVPFGESASSGQSAGDGAIRVELGDAARAGLGGFLTVLPFEGSNLLPGQVVYLAGPQRQGTQAFFYDGARSLDRIPVVYNGSLLLSPQETAALTTAQGAVVLARQEQTRSVVRTENVAGKVINGVVVEVGPGRPATEGEGGAGKPASCDPEEGGLACNP